MQPQASDSEHVSVGDVMETLTWNRQRSAEELTSFVLNRHALLEDVDLGI